MSGILEQEFDNIRKYISKGRQIEAVKQEDGTFVAQKVRMGATGLDLTPPIQTPLKTGEAQTISQTKKELGPALAGVGAGPAVGIGEVIDLGLGVLKGAYNAVNPDADQGRFEAFMTTLGEQFESGAGEGVRSIVLNLGQRAGLDEEQMEVLDEGMTAGSFFGYGGAAKAAPKVAAKLGDAIEGAGDAAKARMADADGSVTLGMNIDPDPAIAAFGDAVAKFRAPTETEPGIIAFHGSGKDFDEFKLEKIGTGEGAQAYGYGLYFTDSEDIARVYRDSIRGLQDMKGKIDVTYKGKPFKDLGDTAAAEAAGPEYKAITGILERMNKGQSKDAAKKDIIKVIEGEIRNLPSDGDDELTGLLKSSLQSELDAIRSVDVNDIVQSKGKMYKVSLTPKPEDMIDYQIPIEQQPKNIQQTVKKALSYIYPDVKDPALSMRGSDLQNAIINRIAVSRGNIEKMSDPIDADIARIDPNNEKTEAAIAAQIMLEQGIPGMKYRDAGSRGGAKSLKDASFNYVVFDDKMIKILEKYGIVGPVAITGVAATQQEGESDGTRA